MVTRLTLLPRTPCTWSNRMIFHLPTQCRVCYIYRMRSNIFGHWLKIAYVYALCLFVIYSRYWRICLPWIDAIFYCQIATKTHSGDLIGSRLFIASLTSREYESFQQQQKTNTQPIIAELPSHITSILRLLRKKKKKKSINVVRFPCE